MWVVEVDLLLVCWPKIICFKMSMKIDLVYVYVVQIDFISVWGIKFDLISV